MPTIKSKSTRKGSKKGHPLTGRKKVKRRPKKVRGIKKSKPLARPLPLATVALYYWGVSYSIVSY